MNLTEILVPANSEGKETDLKFNRKFADPAAALECFRRAKLRLLNPNIWHDLAGWATARFRPFDADGMILKRLIMQGDYVRIDIPGPGPKAGHGFDWVRVEQIEDRSDPAAMETSFGLKLRPCAGPGQTGGVVAHFFKEHATSTYIVEQLCNEVIVHYYGRNEVPNSGTGDVLDNLRNSIVAVGAFAFLSEAQWSALGTALLAEEIGG